jgi:hypothetical protein
VVRFCAEHDLLPLVHEALRLAEATLQPVGRPVIELEVDPETSDEWVVITVPVAGSTAEVVRRKRKYTAQWVGVATYDKREKVRLLFTVVAP